jgi:hypothetical protein
LPAVGRQAKALCTVCALVLLPITSPKPCARTLCVLGFVTSTRPMPPTDWSVPPALPPPAQVSLLCTSRSPVSAGLEVESVCAPTPT